jgi:hypothetical protein
MRSRVALTVGLLVAALAVGLLAGAFTLQSAAQSSPRQVASDVQTKPSYDLPDRRGLSDFGLALTSTPLASADGSRSRVQVRNQGSRPIADNRNSTTHVLGRISNGHWIPGGWI